MDDTLRKFNMGRSELRICFFGPSGSGKSTCFAFAEDAIHEHINRGLRVIHADVARPLHESQRLVYLQMGLIPHDAIEIPHDGKLLSFLASHFESHLGPIFMSYVEGMSVAYYKHVAFVNTDCRNNSYKALHDAGFWFVRVKTGESVIRERLTERGDITPYDPLSDVERSDGIKPHLTMRNDGTLDELRANVNRAVQDAILMREDFVRG